MKKATKGLLFTLALCLITVSSFAQIVKDSLKAEIHQYVQIAVQAYEAYTGKTRIIPFLPDGVTISVVTAFLTSIIFLVWRAIEKKKLEKAHAAQVAALTQKS